MIRPRSNKPCFTDKAAVCSSVLSKKAMAFWANARSLVEFFEKKHILI